MRQALAALGLVEPSPPEGEPRRATAIATRRIGAVFTKVLVANRGEIAIRVFRTLREMGIASVAVYSEADRDAPFVALRRRGVPDRPGAVAAELPASRDDRRAPRCGRGAEAVHPGFGFLAENAAFARALRRGRARLRRPAARGDRGDGVARSSARELMARGRRADRPGRAPIRSTSVDDARRIAAEIGYPVAIKAAAGGGGKGIQVVRDEGELEARYAVVAARGQGLLRRRHGLPRALPGRPAPRRGAGARRRPRQRDPPRRARLQRSSAATRSSSRRRRRRRSTPELRERIGAIAVAAARAVGYTRRRHGRGPARRGRLVLLPRDEHAPAGGAHDHRDGDRARPRARAGLRSPPGEPLGCDQDEVRLHGHAIQCRINAEDAARGLRAHAGPDHPAIASPPAPACGSTRASRAGTDDLRPLRPDVRQADRLGRGPRPGAAADAARARRVRDRRRDDPDPAPRARSCGIPSSPPAARCASSSRAAASRASMEVPGTGTVPGTGLPARPRCARTSPRSTGSASRSTVEVPEHPGRARLRQRRAALAARDAAGHHEVDVVRSPMQGTVLRVGVASGDDVAAGQVLVVSRR